MLLCSTAFLWLGLGILIPTLDMFSSPTVSPLFLRVIPVLVAVMYLLCSISVLSEPDDGIEKSIAGTGGIVAGIVHFIHVALQYFNGATQQ